MPPRPRPILRRLGYAAALSATAGAGYATYAAYRPRDLPGSGERAAVPPVPAALRRGELPAFPEAPARAEQIAALRASGGPGGGSGRRGEGAAAEGWDGLLRRGWAWARGQASPPPPPAAAAGSAAAAAAAAPGDGGDAGEPFDLLVIGGGATGAGIALDAATRGLRVALVERGDFASGTSSKSTKLVHGGVRYLEKAVWEMDYSQCVPSWRAQGCNRGR
jgi:glycerol-3-phosphate dehydrogenase